MKVGSYAKVVQQMRLWAHNLNQLGLSQNAVAYLASPAPNSLQWLTANDARQLGIEVEMFQPTKYREHERPTTCTPDPRGGNGRSDSTQPIGFVRLLPSRIYLQCPKLDMPSEERCSYRPSKCQGPVGVQEVCRAEPKRLSLTIYEKTDYPGKDYDHTSGASFEQCLTTCNSAYQCKVFTYDARHKQCWLKSSLGQAKASRRAVSEVK